MHTAVYRRGIRPGGGLEGGVESRRCSRGRGRGLDLRRRIRLTGEQLHSRLIGPGCQCSRADKRRRLRGGLRPVVSGLRGRRSQRVGCVCVCVRFERRGNKNCFCGGTGSPGERWCWLRNGCELEVTHTIPTGELGQSNGERQGGTQRTSSKVLGTGGSSR
jgi:hypothetical protein